MSASKVRADYEAPAYIAAEFRRQARQQRLLGQRHSQMNILRTGGWVGIGADKSYAEMLSIVLPALQRMVIAQKVLGLK